ncbi:MAG: glycosyltransferase, partial [Actinomycetota bacterium]
RIDAGDVARSIRAVGGRSVRAAGRRLPAPIRAALRETPLTRLVVGSGDGPPQPTFSVVIPIYESPLSHLREQLEAVRTQTYPLWECVVVDDGSPSSDAVDLAEEFAAIDDRFRVIRRAANGGIAAATNDGLDAASNDWIVFSDHDDRMLPSALAAIATHLVSHPDDDVVYTDERLIDEDGRALVVYRKPDYSHHRFVAMNYFCHIVTMRRSLVEEIGRLDPAMEPSADRDFNLRASERATSIGHVPDILYEWRAIDGSVAKDLTEKQGVSESTLAGAAAHLARTGTPGRAVPAPRHPYLIRIERPPAVGSPTWLAWDDATTVASLDDLLRDALDRGDRAGGADHVVLHHRAVEPGTWISPLQSLVELGGVGAAAPCVLTADRRVVSAGRIHHPAMREMMPGVDVDDPGPWGLHQVDHEAAGVDPSAVVFDRAALGAIGGFDVDALLGPSADRDDADSELAGEFGMDLFVALVSTRLREYGTPVVWSPLSTITVPWEPPSWPDDLRRRAASRRFGRIVPGLLVDPFSPIEIRR